MKMSELIAAYGDERVEFQNLDRDAHNLQYHAGKGTDVTFRTGTVMHPDGLEKLGLVIWLDRKRVKDVIDGKVASSEPPQEIADEVDAD